MSLIISRDIILSAQVAADGNKPLIGWQNVVTAGGLSSDTADVDYPVTNLANPQTFSRWLAGDTTAQTVTVVTGTIEYLDYLAIARHNLASAGISATIEGKLGVGDWFELVQETQLPDNGPALFRFDPQPLTDIRISLGSGSEAATIAVMYVGALLTLERKIWVGQVAPNDGVETTLTNGRSENGEYLGTIETSRRTAIKVPLSLIDPDWHRANLRPLLNARPRVPFFFAWRPEDYPFEVGYMWLATPPKPTNESPSGLIALSLDLQGVA